MADAYGDENQEETSSVSSRSLWDYKMFADRNKNYSKRKKDEELRNHSHDSTAACTRAHKRSCPQHHPGEATLRLFRAVLPFYPLRKAKAS